MPEVAPSSHLARGEGATDMVSSKNGECRLVPDWNLSGHSGFMHTHMDTCVSTQTDTDAHNTCTDTEININIGVYTFDNSSVMMSLENVH